MRHLLAVPLLALTAFTVGVPAWAQTLEPEPSGIEEAAPEAAAPEAATPQDTGVKWTDFGLQEIGDILKLSDEDPRTIAVRLINVAIGFLAIITLVMVLYGGFQFLVSGGQEERTKRAGATIRSAIVGLIIILAGWAAVRYVLEQFVAATTGS